MGSIQGLAQAALARRFGDVLERSASMAPRPWLDALGYLVDPESGSTPVGKSRVDVLARQMAVSTITDGDLVLALEQVRGGAGSELEGSGKRPAKFFAAYSSSVLALNCFAPFLESHQLTLAGHWLNEPSLERVLTIGGGCGRPNLDLLSAQDGQVVAVESKCTEHLKTKTAAIGSDFATLRDRAATPRQRAGDPYERRLHQFTRGNGPVALCEELAADATAYRHLDATQLLKHYLGVRSEFGDFHATLLYLYWEPSNANELDVCRKHREELGRVAPLLTDDAVNFVALGYRDLWSEWACSGDEFLRRHAAVLAERYEVAVSLPGREAPLRTGNPRPEDDAA